MRHTSHLQHTEDLLLAHRWLREKLTHSIDISHRHHGINVFMELMLLKECVELQDHFIQHTSIWQKFWKWDTYQEYSNSLCYSVRFLMWFTGVLIVATLALEVFTFGFFGQFLGLLSLSI